MNLVYHIIRMDLKNQNKVLFTGMFQKNRRLSLMTVSFSEKKYIYFHTLRLILLYQTFLKAINQPNLVSKIGSDR